MRSAPRSPRVGGRGRAGGRARLGCLHRPSRAFPPALLALAALGAACSCPQKRVLVDDFEDCTGTCGWDVSGGDAAVVSTILPGEHGLRLDGGSTAVKAIAVTSIDTTWSLQLVADCPAGLLATLAATVPGSGDVSLAVMLAIDNSLTSSGDSPDYSGATFVPLVGDITLPTGAMTASVHQITLQPSAGAACTVDVVRITAGSTCSG